MKREEPIGSKQGDLPNKNQITIYWTELFGNRVNFDTHGNWRRKEEVQEMNNAITDNSEGGTTINC